MNIGTLKNCPDCRNIDCTCPKQIGKKITMNQTIMNKEQEKEEIKNTLFQYYNGTKIVEDTNLITENEGNMLWDKYFEEAKENLKDGQNVQMCLWGNCATYTDYSEVIKEIDYRDCNVEGNTIYKITKTVVK